jgi:hypothetical protein
MNAKTTPLCGFIAAILCCLAYVSARGTSADSHSSSIHQGPAAEQKPKTIPGMAIEELLHVYPEELGDLQYSSDQTELAGLLQKLGRKVEAFFRDFSNTSANERVRLERFGFAGRVEDSSRQEFNYMILVRQGKEGIVFQEDRSDSKGRPVNPKRVAGFVMTSGYAGLCLLLHPSHQFGSEFRYLGRQTVEPFAHVIGFAQKPKVGDYISGYDDREMAVTVPILFQGIVWVHPETCQVLRIHTDLLEPITLVSLTKQTNDVKLSATHFDGVAMPVWLPREVTVGWRLAGRVYRNQHIYSDYKLFSVESYDKMEQPQPKQ